MKVRKEIIGDKVFFVPSGGFFNAFASLCKFGDVGESGFLKMV